MFEVFGFDEAHRHCPSCVNAKRLLEVRGKQFMFKPINVQENMDEVVKRLGREKMTLPQIWHNGEYVGGFTELRKYI